MTKKELVQIIQEGGQSELTANKMANAIYDAIAEKVYPADMATKQDIAELRLSTKQDISKLEVNLIDRIASAKTSMGLYIGTATGFLSILMTIFKFMGHS